MPALAQRSSGYSRIKTLSLARNYLTGHTGGLAGAYNLETLLLNRNMLRCIIQLVGLFVS